MMTKIKICGLSRACDIEYANALLPDFIGFVFFPRSRRFVDEQKARELKTALDRRIKAVGVFVNAPPEFICRLYTDGIIDCAQLHGAEDNTYIKNIKSLCSVPVIKAFSVRGEHDIASAEMSCADYVLLDNGEGGSGCSFDWNLLLKMKRPYFLAGGLSPKNISEAACRFQPYAVDVSSGVETDGFKDFDKMKLIIETVRASHTS